VPSGGRADVPVTRNHASLIVQGRDRPGIVAAVTTVLAGCGANIVSLDQYSDDPHGGAFFQRTVFGLDRLPAVLPQIEQDVVRVTHADSAADLARRGADVERLVLSRAVTWHSEDRVIRNGNHTIVFP